MCGEIVQEDDPAVSWQRKKSQNDRPRERKQGEELPQSDVAKKVNSFVRFVQ